MTRSNGMQSSLPGYEFTIVSNQGRFIDESIGEMKQTALIGIFLAVMVLFFFLRQFGATAIISLAIPFSIVATFNLMYFNRLTLNLMTLGGLALAAGIVWLLAEAEYEVGLTLLIEGAGTTAVTVKPAVPDD